MSLYRAMGMQARIETTLGIMVRHNGAANLISRRDLILQKMAAGARVTIRKNGDRVLMSPDGAFLDTRNITKIGLDFAQQLETSGQLK
jgi:hypothetical protein